MSIQPLSDSEQTIDHGWQTWESMPAGNGRDALRDHLWRMEDNADDGDDLRRDVVHDHLAGIEPECIGDLLELADAALAIRRRACRTRVRASQVGGRR